MTGAIELRVGLGGWVLLRSMPSMRALVRFRVAPDGRLETAELYIPGGEGPLTAAALRDLPLGRLEAFANTPSVREAIAQTMDASDVGPERAAQELVRRGLGNELVIPSGPGSLKFRVPTSKPWPEEFYEDFAARYQRAAAILPGPAAAIAKANNLPLSTIHRWTREARRRGLLGAGRSGKSG